MVSDPPASPAKVVDYTGKICKSAESYGYFYKTKLPLTVDKNFEDCYFWMNNEYQSALDRLEERGQTMNMKNFYHLTNSVIKAWCLDDYENEDGDLVAREDDEECGPPFIDYRLRIDEW